MVMGKVIYSQFSLKFRSIQNIVPRYYAFLIHLSHITSIELFYK